MQDEYDRIYQSKKRKQDDEDEYDAIYPSTRKVAPSAPAAPEKLGTLAKTWENLKGLVTHPEELILSPLRDLKTNFSPVQGTKYRPSDRFGAPGGAFDRLPDGTIITKENTPNSVTEEEAKQAGINTGINAVTGAIPGLGKVGQRLVAAGTGAYYDKEDRLAGALTGLVAGEVVPRAMTLGARATGALRNRVASGMGDVRATAKGEAALSEMLGGLKSEVGPVTRRKGPQSTQSAIDALIDAGVVTTPKSSGNPKSGIGRLTPDEMRAREVAKQRAIDEMLIQEEAARVAATERISQGLADSRVIPGTPRGPAYDKPLPDGYLATADKPLPEVSVFPGQKPIIDPEVKASRVADERLAKAEQREAERLMTKEVKAIDKAAADEAAAAIADAEKAAKQAQKDTEKATKTLTQEKAKAAREAEKAALTADRAAQAAAKAAKLQADAAALEAAKAVGKDAVKEVRAQQAAEKAAQRAADAQAKADFAAQAALDAQAKRALADEAAAKTVADMTPPSTETAAGMLNTANAQYNRTQRGKMAAQAALARRKPLNVAPVADQVEGAPVASVAPIAPLDAPVAPLAAPLTPSNAAAIPEVPPAATGAVGAPPVAPDTGTPITSPWKAAEEPYINWRTLGEGSDDPFTRTIAARVRGELETPVMAEKLRQLRGSASFDEQLAAADDSYFIQKLNLDRKLTDPMKLAKLTGAQKQRMVQVGLENVAMSKAISEEILKGNLSPDDLALAHAKLDMLDQGASEIWQMAAREGSQHGRDLGIGRMVAGMSTDPSVWLVRAQRALGDKPMSKDVVSTIMRLAKEAAEACGGG